MKKTGIKAEFNEFVKIKSIKSGFSLMESLVSLMILVLVIMLTLASITRKKTVPLNKTTISGMYACWYDGSSLQYLKYSGQTKVAGGSTSSCTLDMDRRAYRYYIYALGSRKCTGSAKSTCVEGQTVQYVLPAPSGEDEDEMTLQIDLGDSSKTANTNGGATTITQNDDTIVKALGGINKSDNGLVAGNIESCKLIAGTPCSSGYYPKCEVSNTTSDTLEAKGNPYSTSFVITCRDSDGTVDGDQTSVYSIDSIDKVDSTYGVRYATTDGYKFKIIEKDSSLKASALGSSEYSVFHRYLKMLPQNIQNGLTDTLLEYYAVRNSSTAVKYNHGIVMVIW